MNLNNNNHDDPEGPDTPEGDTEQHLHSLPYLVEQQYNFEDADFLIFAEADFGSKTVTFETFSSGPDGEDVYIRTAFQVAFKVHKAKLAAISPVFEDMFTICSTQSESDGNLSRVRLVEGLDTVKILLGHIYGDEERVIYMRDLSWSILSRALSAAYKYEMFRLVAHVIDVLSSKPIQVPQDTLPVIGVLETLTASSYKATPLYGILIDKLSSFPMSSALALYNFDQRTVPSAVISILRKRDKALQASIKHLIWAMSRDKDLTRKSKLVSNLERFCDLFGILDSLPTAPMPPSSHITNCAWHGNDGKTTATGWGESYWGGDHEGWDSRNYSKDGQLHWKSALCTFIKDSRNE